MGFSEAIKLEVRRKAAFQCCRCHEVGVDVHHILPQKDGGKDDIDNAAPLCQNCHDRFGDNPQKRKEIRQMRDWWYDVVAEKYSGEEYLKRLQTLDESLRGFHDDQKTKLEEIHRAMMEVLKSVHGAKIDDENEIKTKVTTYVHLGHSFCRRIHCPFCKRDVTVELEREHPGITNYAVSDKTPKTDFFNTVRFPNFSIADFQDILARCPYCSREFNLKNALWVGGIL